MRDFKILDSNRYYLPNTNQRFVHIATITQSLREFMAFIDRHTNKFYCEEITGGSLKQIEEDSLFEDIGNFIISNNLVTIWSGSNTEDLPTSVNKEK